MASMRCFTTFRPVRNAILGVFLDRFNHVAPIKKMHRVRTVLSQQRRATQMVLARVFSKSGSIYWASSGTSLQSIRASKHVFAFSHASVTNVDQERA